VDEGGHLYLAKHAVGVSEAYLTVEKEAQLAALRKRRALYTPVRPCIHPAGRIVIVVDDGVATGSSMVAALRSVRAKGPAKLIAAMAVAPPDTLRRMAAEAEEVVCLEAPALFYAVGQFFEDFSQVSDAEVVAILRQSCPQPVPVA